MLNQGTVKTSGCKWCHKLVVGSREQFCRSCLLRQGKDLQVVADYLCESPGATLAQIIRATGVSHRMLMELLRSKRLVRAVVALALETNCPKCGEPTQVGRGCPTCSLAELAPRAEGCALTGRPSARPDPAFTPKRRKHLPSRRRFKQSVRAVHFTRVK